VIVLFGATGDLARRKLLPGLFNLHCAGLMPDRYRVIGTSRPASALTDDAFRERARSAVEERGMRRASGDAWDAFAARLSFAAVDVENPSTLVEAVDRAEREIDGRPRRLYHLAIPPGAFAAMVAMLGTSGLAERARVIVEKPFGTDLASALALNKALHAVFPEADVFRIDHFLGKESVENILALRFANGLFEPIWNRVHVDHVQIDVPETLTVAGRSGFYDPTGAFRDMVVTHLFQVLGFIAMEPPTMLTEKAVRDETSKVFASMKPIDPERVVRGQYDGYRGEDGIDPASGTETFVALEIELDNWRWAGVPFFLRTGKSLAQSCQVITLAFREPPLHMFALAGDMPADGRPNELVIDFKDPGSISAMFLAKAPGPDVRLSEVAMTFSYESAFHASELEGYERLVHDAMLGDQTLFTRGDGIERLWEVAMPLLEDPPELLVYEPGSWGPPEVDALIAPRHWHLPERPRRS
jgi:glucose-6-phosphate 1-dehydrogenase